MLSTFCLALVVYTEARGEPLDGQLLVAEVVLNRAQRAEELCSSSDCAMESYPDRVCDVAFDHKQFSGLSKPLDLETIFDDPAWDTSVEVAYKALEGGTLGLGASHYHNTKVTPYWSKKLTVLGKYGKHIFYLEEEQ